MRRKEKQTQILLLGNTVQAVFKAAELANSGKKVLMAVSETYLGADMGQTAAYGLSGAYRDFFPAQCRGKNTLIPDRCKKYLEDLCVEAHADFLYGLYYVEHNDIGDRIQVDMASKGGLYRIYCEQVLFLEAAKANQAEGKKSCCRCWVCDERTGENSLLSVMADTGERESLEEILLSAGKMLLKEYCAAKEKQPFLKLGRFAELPENLPGKLLKGQWEGHRKTEKIYDVIVTGGGTAGAMAALYAARNGAKTLLLEPQYALGGTSTAGGVNAYWFGTCFREVEEIEDEVNHICMKYKVDRKPGIFREYDEFHPGIRGLVLLRDCLLAGVDIELGRMVYDILSSEGKVTGVVSAGRGGKQNYLGKIIIDATGDGDLAVYAGADMNYGSEKDGFTYWASLAQYTGADSCRNNFASMVRLDDAEDMTRFIYLGRRRGGDLFDHGVYVCARESRHLAGKKQVDLRDLCRFSVYEDGLYTCFSNYDPKGRTDSDMTACGYLPPQVKIQIPLSALIPVRRGREIEGLYVAGKAIAATHNSFPSIRMQSDLMHQGAVLGMLAARAALRDCSIGELPSADRKRWIWEMSGDDLSMPDSSGEINWGRIFSQIGQDSRSHWIDVPFSYEEKELSPLLLGVCADKEEILPALLLQIRKYEEEGRADEALPLKKLALFHGCGEYSGEITEDIMRQLKKAFPGLPGRQGSVVCVQLLPDHGVMPEVVYELNLLGFAEDFSMEPFEWVLYRLKEMERDYEDNRKGMYSYLESFAYVAEKSGRKEFIPLLFELMQFPEFTWALQRENQVDLLSERFQILLFLLAKALKRLEDGRGYKMLEKLVLSESLTIQKAAEKELSAENEKPVSKKNEKSW